MQNLEENNEGNVDLLLDMIIMFAYLALIYKEMGGWYPWGYQICVVLYQLHIFEREDQLTKQGVIDIGNKKSIGEVDSTDIIHVWNNKGRNKDGALGNIGQRNVEMHTAHTIIIDACK